jgi:hypothetical protein
VASAEGIHTAEGSWRLLTHWLTHDWRWLALFVAVAAAICLFARLSDRLLRLWDRLLDWEGGKAWPVPAALLPSGIGLVSLFGKSLPQTCQAIIIVLLLLAVATLQAYGQQYNNRDRLKTKNQFADLVDEIRQGRREAQEGRAESEIRFSDLVNEVEQARRNAEEARRDAEARFLDLFGEIESRFKYIANGINDIAAYLASEDEGSGSV